MVIQSGGKADSGFAGAPLYFRLFAGSLLCTYKDRYIYDAFQRNWKNNLVESHVMVNQSRKGRPHTGPYHSLKPSLGIRFFNQVFG